MAKEDNEKKLIAEKITRNKIITKDGWQEITADFITRDYEDEDCDYTEIEAEHWEGGDGTLINAADGFRAKAQGGVTLRRCDACVEDSRRFLTWLFRRNQAVNVYSPVTTSRRCFSCRKSLCERHYVLSNDKHIRCRRCDRNYQLKRFLIQKIIRPLFFTKVRS
jgi:hypothetical protein